MGDEQDSDDPEPGLPRMLQTVGFGELVLITLAGIGFTGYGLLRDVVWLPFTVVLVAIGLATLGSGLVGLVLRWRWTRR